MERQPFIRNQPNRTTSNDMKKRILSLTLAGLTLGSLGHLLFAQVTTHAQGQLATDNAVKGYSTIDQCTYGVRGKFTYRQSGPVAALDIAFSNFDANGALGHISTEVPHTAAVYVNGELAVSAIAVAVESVGGTAEPLVLSLPMEWLDVLLANTNEYELKVWNSAQTEIFGASFVGYSN